MVAAQSVAKLGLKELRIAFDPNVVTGLLQAIHPLAG
jgi:hypothetical protein